MTDLPLYATLAACAALWSQFGTILDRFRSLFIQRITVHGRIGCAVGDYLLANARCWRWGDTLIRSITAWVRPRERMLEVAYENTPVSPVFTFWQRRLFVFLSPTPSGGLSCLPADAEIITLITLRGTLNVSRLIKEALDWQSLKETTGRRYRVMQITQEHRVSHNGDGMEGGTRYRTPTEAPGSSMRPGLCFLHWKEEDIGPPRPTDPFLSYVTSAAAEDCRQDFQQWCSLKSWYTQRGIPWRRGHLLYGQPGTGKTALVRAIAQEADYPVFAYDLSTLDNNAFRRAWESMQESAPCIALLEDIDGVFDGRTNVLASQDGMRSSLTFDCLLNALGGIQTADGVFVFITTNKPETLDEALGRPDGNGASSRPGRIDRTFCIPHASEDQRAAIIQRIADEATPEDLARTADFTASQVTEYAITKALRKTWTIPTP